MGFFQAEPRLHSNFLYSNFLVTMNENVVDGNGESGASLGPLSPPFNEGEKFMDKADAIIGDLNDERNKRDVVVAEIAQRFRGAARGFYTTLGERVAQISSSYAALREKITADIETEAGVIEAAEKELASFAKGLSVFVRNSVRSSVKDSPGKKKMRLDPFMTSPTRGDKLFGKVQKTLGEMSEAKEKSNEKSVKMHGDFIQESEDTLTKFFSQYQLCMDNFNRNVDAITGALTEEYKKVCEFEDQLNTFTDGLESFSEEIGSP